MNDILDKENETKRKSKFKFTIVFYLFGLPILLLGMLFRIQSWEGGFRLMMLGLLLIAVPAAIGIFKSI